MKGLVKQSNSQLATRQAVEAVDLMLSDETRAEKLPALMALGGLPACRDAIKCLLAGTSTPEQAATLVAKAMGTFPIGPSLNEPKLFAKALVELLMPYPFEIGLRTVEELLKEEDWLPSIARFNKKLIGIRGRAWKAWKTIVNSEVVGALITVHPPKLGSKVADSDLFQPPGPGKRFETLDELSERLYGAKAETAQPTPRRASSLGATFADFDPSKLSADDDC
jgi:hypothetical protein